jgi:hypothetical protein
MTRTFLLAAILALAARPALAGANGVVTGAYVEARTAEVFTGGCIMGSEAETVGRQAILAWKIDRGSFNGQSLDGLSIVAAVAGDHNLGIREIGGDKPIVVRSLIFVDDRATPAQRAALVSFVRTMSRGLVGQVVDVQSAPIRFADDTKHIEVSAGQASLSVTKAMSHNPGCGAMQWFHPLAEVEQASIGLTDQHAYSGNALGTRWSDPGKRSAFFGTFRY